MADVVVKVTVAKDGISVDQDPVTVKRDQTICWKSTNDREFRIAFKDRSSSPFDGTNIATDRKTRATADRRPRRDAELHKTYKYTVIDARDSNHLLDPEIIIDTPKSGDGD